MRYLSVCSGIEAATVAWHDMGWQPAAFSEIEPFPSAVLAHHYPTVPNVGDMTKYKEWDIGAIDLLVGGTPCQSFSVAGLRKGLADPRGNLALVYLGIADLFKPKWIVWENVPGVLSSGGGRDFGSFLGALAQLGYGFAYRVLDAQWFGVAQRRRRVFVVGYLGDWRPAAAVLFERQSLSGHPKPSREKGEDPAKSIMASPSQRLDPTLETMISVGILEIKATTYSTPKIGTIKQDSVASCVTKNTGGGGETQNPAFVMQPIPFDITQISCPHNYSRPESGDPCHPLAAGAHPPAIAQPIPLNSMNCFRSPDAAASTGCGLGEEGEAMFTISKTNHHAVAQPIAVDVYNQAIDGQTAATLTEACGGSNTSGPKVMQSMAVRRLTPVECERLQGFPDNYTEIPWRGKAETPDGPRYKALGNSMAVPVMRWIGQRIQGR